MEIEDSEIWELAAKKSGKFEAELTAKITANLRKAFEVELAAKIEETKKTFAEELKI
jgi:hypothetical protein